MDQHVAEGNRRGGSGGSGQGLGAVRGPGTARGGTQHADLREGRAGMTVKITTNDYKLSFGNSTPVVFSATDSISRCSQSPSYARAALSTGMGTVRQADKKDLSPIRSPSSEAGTRTEPPHAQASLRQVETGQYGSILCATHQGKLQRSACKSKT